MSKQVLSIEQMKHLKELGVDDGKANFYWHRTKSLNNYEGWDEWKLHYGVLRLARGFTVINCEYVRTFTLQDILDLLPSETGKDKKTSTIDILKHPQKYILCFWRGELLFKCENSILIDAAYEMLCWVIDNGYLKVK